MRVVVVGTGGIGGYIGARLAKAGVDVLFVARGAHLEALQADGLRLTSTLGDVVLPKVNAVANGAGQPTADALLFTVKGPDTIHAAEGVASMVGPQSMIVTFQNGVEGLDLLQRRFGVPLVLPAVTFIGAIIESPGHIKHVNAPVQRSLFGEVDGRQSERARAFQELSMRAGLSMELVDDILARYWEKFIFVASYAAMCCISRYPVGVWAHTPEMLDMFVEGIREACVIARAKKVSFDEQRVIEESVTFVKNLAPHWKGSMLTDLERGKQIEIGTLSGHIHRMGKELGLPTPFHSTVYRALLPHAAGAQQPLRS
jgi:2-dehydropantoate 2-reductase